MNIHDCEGMTTNEIAAALGVSYKTAWNWAKAAGLSRVYGGTRKAYTMSDKERLRRSERMKAMHADPDFSARLRAGASANMTALHADPDFADRHSQRRSKAWTDNNPQVVE